MPARRLVLPLVDPGRLRKRGEPPELRSRCGELLTCAGIARSRDQRRDVVEQTKSTTRRLPRYLVPPNGDVLPHR